MPAIRERGVESFLDIGCGRGVLMENLVFQHGLQGTGTEIIPYLIERDLKRFTVFPLAIFELGYFEADSFDLALMVDLLDHLRDDAEVDECLGHARRIARLGCMATVGGPGEFRVINEDAGWWRDRFISVFGIAPTEAVDRHGVHLYSVWEEATS
jgi:SAM-dependent methyltransferase